MHESTDSAAGRITVVAPHLDDAVLSRDELIVAQQSVADAPGRAVAEIRADDGN